MTMYDNPRHRAWTAVPLAVIGFCLLMSLVCVYDLNVHGNQDAWAGIVLPPIAALSWAWVYRQIKRSNHAGS